MYRFSGIIEDTGAAARRIQEIVLASHGIILSQGEDGDIVSFFLLFVKFSSFLSFFLLFFIRNLLSPDPGTNFLFHIFSHQSHVAKNK